jgi:hypothetical protein
MAAASLTVGFAVAGTAGATTTHPMYALGAAKHCRSGYVKIRHRGNKRWECGRVGVAPEPPTYVPPPTTTPTTTPPTATVPPVPSTTTGPSPTPTTVPPAGPLSTETTMAAPVTDSVLPPGVCSEAETCFPEDENGALIYTAATQVTTSGAPISPDAGGVTFVFDAPITATNATVPFEYDQFTLSTTEDGQTSCPLQWVSAHVETPYPYFQSEPGSAAMGGVPACTVSDVKLFDFTTGASSACSVPTGAVGDVPPPYFSIADFNDCPSYPATPAADGDYLVGAALNWSVTANYLGDSEDAPSSSATQNLTVGPAAT